MIARDRLRTDPLRIILGVSLAIGFTLVAGGCGDAPVTGMYDGRLVTISGRVHVADDAPLPTVSVNVEGMGYTTSVTVDAAGRFSIEAPAAGDSFDVMVDAGARYHPSLRRLRPLSGEWRDVDVLLIPNRWRIATGRFAGREVEVSMQAALAPENGAGGSMYTVYNPFPPASAPPGAWLFTASYPPDALPIPLYLEHEGAGIEGRQREPIVADDSVVVWDVVGDLEARLGRDLFRPARLDELPAETLSTRDGTLILRPFSAYIEQVPSMTGTARAGASTVCNDERPDPADEACARYGRYTLVHGGVAIDSITGSPLNRVVLQHELVHVLGFGHSCYQPSVMNGCPGPYRGPTMEPDDGDMAASVYDVAYMQLYWRIHAATAELEPEFGLREALEGERLRVGRSRLVTTWPGPPDMM
jgi:hypothetical protein